MKFLLKYKILVFLILLSFFINPVFSQTNKVRFDNLNLQDGVAYDLIYSMLQDSRGFLWFGTMYGLVRYDGVKSKVFRHNPDDPASISFDDIISLFEDSKGFIWIGTWGGGLNKYDPDTKEFEKYSFNLEEKNSISDNIVWSIAEDTSGNMWFGTETGGLNYYDREKNKFVSYKHNDIDDKSIPANFISSLFVDNEGTLWVGTSRSLVKFDSKSKTFINFNSITKEDSIKYTVTEIFQDDEDNLWFGTNNGLYKYSKSTDNLTTYKNNSFQKEVLSDNRITSICFDNNNVLWVGTRNGLNKFDNDSNSFISFHKDPSDPFSLSGDIIQSLLVDESGILWVAAYNGGLNKLKPMVNNFVNYYYDPLNFNSISSNSVRTITEDDESNLWIGTFEKGLNKIDLLTGEISQIKLNRTGEISRGSNYVNSIIVDSNKIYAGTWDGLRIYNIKTKNIDKPEFEDDSGKVFPVAIVKVLLKDNSGNIWIGTHGYGLFKYRDGNFSRVTFDDSDPSFRMLNYILTLYEDSKGYLWIGTYGGLIKYERYSGDYLTYLHNNDDSRSLSNNYVFSVAEDRTGGIWIGTSNGLNKYYQIYENFDHIFENDGLPNSVINSMLPDSQGNLWISTNKGISKFDIEKGSFTNFYKSDGLPGNIFYQGSAYRSGDGVLYFGSNNGMTSFHPENLILSHYKPQIQITGIYNITAEGNNKELVNSNEISYENNKIKIEFAALDFNNPSKNKFKYMLEGYDDNWINSDINTATYTNLSPGTYNFKVKGTNSDGIWNDAFASFEFSVNPPFWQTWWFILIVSLFFISGIYLIHIYRTNKEINKAIEIEKIRQEENEKVRRKTARDFHDELGHRLTRISLLTEIIKRKLPEELKSVKLILDKISENSNELYNGTKDFIWSIDPSNDSLYDLIIRLKDFGDELFSSSPIYFEVNGLDKNLIRTHLTTDYRRNLTLLFKEGMHNSLRHSLSKKIILNSYVKGNDVEITLIDNGKGFIPDYELEKGNGIKNMQSRAEKINGKLNIEAKPGFGTKIIFRGKIQKKSLTYY